MPLTRRELLKFAATLPAVSPLALASVTPSNDRLPPSGSGPGLFFTAAQVPDLSRKFRDDDRFTSLRAHFDGIDRERERTFLRTGVRYNDPLNDFRRVHDLGQDMAFLYLVTGDEDAADLAIESARVMLEFPVWDFFLEAGSGLPMGNQRAPSGMIAMACMIDWLGDRIDTAERNRWLDAIETKGCVLTARSLEAYLDTLHAQPWEINPDTLIYKTRAKFPTDGHRRIEITSQTNLRAAPAGAMGIAVALLRRHRPHTAALGDWQQLAEKNIEAVMELYHADGTYGEGVNYANYTSESIFMGLEAMRRAGYRDLSAGVNWPGQIRFMLEMAMPIERNPYEIINISDAGKHRHQAEFKHPAGRAESRSALPYWVARNYGDGLSQWFADNLAADHNLWSLVFFDDGVKPEAPLNEPKLWIGDVEWVVARTGYRSEDLVACLRSGNGYNHEHADRNSLILKAFGEELVVDPMRPPYAFYDPSWLLRTTAGHSAVLINGEGHFYFNGSEGTNMTPAQARVVDRAEGSGYSMVTSDATQAYRLVDVEIKQVVRSMVVFYDLAVVLIVDRLGMWHHAADYEARFMTENWDGEVKIETDGEGFVVRRPLAEAHATVHCREPVSIAHELLPIAPDRAEKNPYVAVRTGGVQQTTLVTALRLNPLGRTPANVAVKTVDDGFHIAIRGADGRGRCEIDDTGMYPRFAIHTS